MFHRGWFLVSVSEPGLSHQVSRVVSDYGVACLEPLSDRQIAHLAGSPRWAGCVTNLTVENWPVLQRLREKLPSLPVLVVLEPSQVKHLNALQALSFECVVSPLALPNLVGFVQRAFAVSFLPDDRVARLVSHLATQRSLTARELQLLSFSLGNEPRDRVRRRLGIGENTLKTQIRGLLRKCGERSVDSLAKNVLRAAVLAEKSLAHEVNPVAPWLLSAKSA